MNAALNFARHPLVCTVDADSLLDHQSLLRAARPFAEQPETLVAVGGTIRVANGCEVHGGTVVREGAPRQFLPLLQTIEYLRAFLLARLALSRLDAVSIISGAFGLFRRRAVLAVGGYTHDTVGEDMELVVKLHRHACERQQPARVQFIPDPVCWTEVPKTLAVLRRQRTRWQRGLCETLWRHRAMLGRPRFGRMGVLGLPLHVVFDVVAPLIECLGFICVPLFWLAGALDSDFLLAYFAIIAVFGVFMSMLALVIAEFTVFHTTRRSDLVLYAFAAVAENFGYRQLNSWWRLVGIWQFLRRQRSWGDMPRAGFQPGPTPTARRD